MNVETDAYIVTRNGSDCHLRLLHTSDGEDRPYFLQLEGSGAVRAANDPGQSYWPYTYLSSAEVEAAIVQRFANECPAVLENGSEGLECRNRLVSWFASRTAYLNFDPPGAAVSGGVGIDIVNDEVFWEGNKL